MRLFLTLAACVLLVRATPAAGCSLPLKNMTIETVRIDGRGPFRFLLDTGASMTVVDSRLGIAASSPVEALTTSGPVLVGRGIASIEAGSIAAAGLDVLVMDLPRLPSHGRIDGILGMNFVKGRSFLLDRRCLHVDAPPIEGKELPAQEVASRVAITMDGASFVLDSGASFPVLMTARARRLAARTGTVEITTASGRQLTERARFRNREAVFAPPTGDPREDGLLPVTMFRRIWVEAGRRWVIVEGGNEPLAPGP